MRKGASQGFRLVARYDKTQNVVTPLTMIYKGDSAYVPEKEVLAAIKALDATGPEQPSEQPGRRDGFTASAFIRDLADRLATRVQLTTDGHKVYLEAVEGAFGNAIDYAMLVKTYEGDSGKPATAERRYSPAVCTGIREQTITSDPDPEHISTSYVERSNLTIRMSVRRFTRLTNAFSKKLDNHKAALALHFMHYNFARIHKTLQVTPAMEAGVSDHVWGLDEIARLVAA